MLPAVDYDPTDLRDRDVRDAERQRRILAAAHEESEDLVRLLSESWGRRQVRQQLRDAGFDPALDGVGTVFHQDHSVMAYREGQRVRALQLVWPIMRLIASGQLPVETFRKLMTEKDQ